MKVPLSELIKFEYKLLIKDFKRRICRSETVITYSIFMAGVLSIFSLLYLFLFILPQELRFSILQTLSYFHLSPYQLLLTTFNLILVLFIIKGIVLLPHGIKFSKADLEIIIPLPVDFRSLYLAKYFRTLPKILVTDSILLFIISPALLYFKISLLYIVYLAFSIIAFSLFLQLLEIISYLVTTSILKKLKNRYIKTIFIALISTLSGLIFLIVPYIRSKTFLTEILPSKPLTDMFYLLVHPSSIQTQYITRLIHILLSFLTLFLVSYFLAEKFFSSETCIEGKTKMTRIPLLLGKAKWKLLNVKRRSFLIMIKDFWVDFRTQYFIYFLTSMATSIAILLIRNAIKLPEMTLIIMMVDVKVLIVLFLFILFIFSISPSINSFLNEAEHLWILKSLPILPTEIIIGKFVYSLLLTATTLTPILIVLASLLPPLERNTLIIFTPFIYMLSSAEGVLSSILFLNPDEKPHIPSTLFIFYLSILFITIYPLILLIYLTLYSPILLLLTGTIIADLSIFITYKLLTKAAKLILKKES